MARDAVGRFRFSLIRRRPLRSGSCGSVPDLIPIGSRPLPRMRRRTVGFVGSRRPSSKKNERVRGRFRRFVLDAGGLPYWSRGSVARVIAGRQRHRPRSDRREWPRRIRGWPRPCQESERRIRRKTVLRIGDPRAGKGQVIGISADVALQWTGSYTETLRTFANTITTTEGGAHEDRSPRGARIRPQAVVPRWQCHRDPAPLLLLALRYRRCG